MTLNNLLETRSAYDPCSGKAPSQVTQTIAELHAQLRSSPFFPLRTVTCVYREGRFVLHGCVPTYHCKQLAQSIALGTSGVDRLENQIEVSLMSQPRHW